jgi:hypothetical protein
VNLTDAGYSHKREAAMMSRDAALFNETLALGDGSLSAVEGFIDNCRHLIGGRKTLRCRSRVR